MTINFEELEQQELNYKTVISVLKAMYEEFNSAALSTLILNEFVEGITKVDGTLDEFQLVLSNVPTSISDILIVSEDGSLVITPSSILTIDGNTINIKSTSINTESTFFVTYKY
jgi:hypothetical protein